MKDHFEDEWNTYLQYEKHTHPDYQDDIECLAQGYAAAKLHCEVRGQKLTSNIKGTDFIKDGAKAVASGKLISRWQV